MANGQRFFFPSHGFCPIPIRAQDLQISAMLGQVNSFLASAYIEIFIISHFKSVYKPQPALCNFLFQVCIQALSSCSVSLVILSFFFFFLAQRYHFSHLEPSKFSSPIALPTIHASLYLTANGLLSTECLVCTWTGALFTQVTQIQPIHKLNTRKISWSTQGPSQESDSSRNTV